MRATRNPQFTPKLIWPASGKLYVTNALLCTLPKHFPAATNCQRHPPSFFLLFSHFSTFQLLDKPWSQVSPLPPPRFLPSIFIAHSRYSNPTARRFFHRMLCQFRSPVPLVLCVKVHESFRGSFRGSLRGSFHGRHGSFHG